jgi:hypothetical protein
MTQSPIIKPFNSFVMLKPVNGSNGANFGEKTVSSKAKAGQRAMRRVAPGVATKIGRLTRDFFGPGRAKRASKVELLEQKSYNPA